MTEIHSIVLNGPWPIARVHIPVETGLTAIVGQNGAGKTRLLDAARDLLRLTAIGSASEIRSSTWAAYGATGGVVLDLADAAGEDTPPLLGQFDIPPEVATELSAAPALTVLESWARVEELADSVTWDAARVLAAASKLGFTEDEAEGLLGRELLWLDPTGCAWLALDADDPILVEHRDGLMVEPDWQLNWSAQARYAGLSRADALPLPPGPEALGLPPEPRWGAVPILRLGRYMDRPAPPVVPDGDFGVEGSLDEVTWDVLRRHFDLSDPEVLASRALRNVCERFSDVAGQVLLNLLPGAPTLRLVVDAQPPRLAWHASDGVTSAPLPSLSHLSRAEQRWVAYAVHAALATELDPDEQSTPGEAPPRGDAVVPIDEPERSLHVLAVAHLARNLSSLGRVVLAATHSPEIVEAADQILVVTRSAEGVGVIEIDHDQWQRQQALDELVGMTPAHLAPTWRVLVVVEGPHDHMLLRAWFGARLEAARVHIVVAGGLYDLGETGGPAPSGAPRRAPDAAIVGRNQLEVSAIFDLTRCPVLVLTDELNLADDNRTPVTPEQVLAELRADPDRRRASSRAYGRAGACARKGDRAGAAMFQLLSKSLEAGRGAGRLHVRSFREWDVLCYIEPGRLLDRRYQTWDDVRSEFVSRHGHFDGRRFKKLHRLTNALVEVAAREQSGPTPQHAAEWESMITAIEHLAAERFET